MDSRVSAIDPTFNLAWEKGRDYGFKYMEHCREWVKVAQERRVRDFPLQLTLETSTTCNLSCKMCMRRQLRLPSVYMSLRQWTNLVNEGVENGMQSIKPNYRNEPTMHPQLSTMLQFAREKKVQEIIMNTNGKYPSVLNGRLAQGLTEIAFSLDATTEEVYRKVRPGGTLGRAEHNARQMVRLTRAYPSLRVRVAFVVQPDNLHQVQDFMNRWRQAGVDKIVVNPCYNPQGKGEDRTAGVKWVQNDRFVCPQIYQRLVVTATGDVLPCCGAYDESIKLGNVFKEGLPMVEYWKGRKLDNLRKMHEAGQFKDIPTCAKCALSFVPMPVEVVK